MYTYFKNKNRHYGLFINTLILGIAVFFSACELEYELPEANSIPDKTPPSAAFDYEQNEADFLSFNFVNLSVSATDFMWEFGDGKSSAEKNPSNTYPEEGTYTVSLTAMDKLGVSSTTTMDIVVEEPENNFVPVILEPGFEDNSLPDGSGDGRDSWRNDLGGVIQITSGPVHEGDQAAKLPSGGDRVGYQQVAVSPNTDYRISFYYTMKSDPGTLTVAVLDREITDLAEIDDAALVKLDLTDNSEPNSFVNEILSFNSGDNSVVGIIFTNMGSECRLDSFSFLE